MSKSTYIIVTAVVFTIMGAVQFARIVFGWPAEIGTFSVPMWFSYVAVIVTGGLAAFGFRLSWGARPSA